MNRITLNTEYENPLGFHPNELFGIAMDRAEVLTEAMGEVAMKEGAKQPPYLFQDFIELAETEDEQAFIVFILGMKIQRDTRSQRSMMNDLGLGAGDLAEAMRKFKS